MQKFVIIGGTGRSGTNLARRIIGSNSKIAIPPGEFSFFANYSMGKTVKEILANERLKNWKVDYSDLYDCKPQEVFVQILKRYAFNVGKEIPGEKTPFNEFYFNEIKEILKGFEIRFIHLVRNPFDVMASYKHFDAVTSKNSYKKRNISHYIFKWQKSVTIGLARAYNNPEEYYLLKFEDLASNPQRKTRELCEFLEVDFEEDRMLGLTDYIGHKDNTSFPDVAAKIHQNYQAIKKPESRKHFLTEKEIRQIGTICGELARGMGYIDNDFEPFSSGKRKLTLAEKIKRHLINQLLIRAF